MKKLHIFVYLKKYGPKKILYSLSRVVHHTILLFLIHIRIRDSCKRHWARNAGCLCIGEREYKALKFFFPYFIVNSVLTLKLDNIFFFASSFTQETKNYKADHKLTKSQRERTCLILSYSLFYKCYKKKCEEQN
jgi:hypothetical protein